ncbi:MAG: hypothetical protein ACR2RL_21575 [Gammaproteobacteria bacterium]
MHGRDVETHHRSQKQEAQHHRDRREFLRSAGFAESAERARFNKIPVASLITVFSLQCMDCQQRWQLTLLQIENQTTLQYDKVDENGVSVFNDSDA